MNTKPEIEFVNLKRSQYTCLLLQNKYVNFLFVCNHAFKVGIHVPIPDTFTFNKTNPNRKKLKFFLKIFLLFIIFVLILML